jgi:hypothetical protein
MEPYMDRVFEVPAPPEQVWPVISDLRSTYTHGDPKAIVTMDGPERPVGKGAVFQLKTGSGLKSTWTITTWAPPRELAYHVQLGVFDGGITSVTIEPTPAGSRLCIRVPLREWPDTWSIVRWMVQPLVRREARIQGERFERMVRDRVG